MKPSSIGQDDMYDRLERMQRQQNEASRATTQRDICQATMVGSPTLSGGDTRVVPADWRSSPGAFTGGDGATVPGANSLDMFKYNVLNPAGGTVRASYIQIPYAGRWDLSCVAFWGSVSSSAVAGCGLVRNNAFTSNPWSTATSILGYQHITVPTNFSTTTAVHVSVKLEAGDIISPAFYANTARTLRGENDTGGTAGTYFMAQYNGPV